MLEFKADSINNDRIREFCNIYQTTAFVPGNSTSKKVNKKKLNAFIGVTVKKNFG
jgi:hypothetical protein